MPFTPRHVVALVPSGLALALALTLSSVLTSPAASAPVAVETPTTAEAAVIATASGPVEVQRDDASGRVEFVSGAADLAPDVADGAGPRRKATAWLGQHADLFAVVPDQLSVRRVQSTAFGTTVTLTQQVRGVPVWGATLQVNLDPDDRLVSVNGHVVPALDLSVTPTRRSTDAVALAIAAVRAEPPTNESGARADLTGATGQADLVVYETGSALGQSGTSHLAWDVTVAAGASVRERVIVQDSSGKLLNRWSDAPAALPDRALDTWTGNGGTPGDITDDTWSPTWAEGDPTSTLTGAQRALVDTTGEAWWFFANTFGQNSFDNAGTRMLIRADEKTSGCPNASWWNGYVSVCQGLGVDDVIAHEWGHAWTENTSGLIYQWQAGALNESYSDVWGETIDLINAREDTGEDLNRRTDGTCGPQRADRVGLTITSPASIQGPCTAATGLNTLVPTSPHLAEVVVGRDGVSPGTDGCTALTNAAEVAGLWAYLDVSTCTFSTAINNARAAGAMGVVFGNDQAANPRSFQDNGMLPAVLVSKADGARFRSLASGQRSSIRLAPLTPRDSSSRWLVGEQAIGFAGGALRDMWNPNCLGDPAKVSDAQYHCDRSDSGGVHFNSGVPNRAYSLLVDGGTFNGRTVRGIGLDKAAHLWWRVGQAYLTPTSDFVDFAGSLQSACASMVGHDLVPLSSSPAGPAGVSAPMTSSDCAQVGLAIAATGLTTDVATRCRSTAYFTAGSVPGCGPGHVSTTVMSQTFESGLGGWAPGRTTRATPGPSTWQAVAQVPNNPGHAAFVRNDDDASCGTNGFSRAGVSSLTSPWVRSPQDSAGLFLQFRHALALEQGYDGANVKIQVAGGGWRELSPATYLLNAPRDVISTGGDPTANPMAGQSVWAGNGHHQVSSGWGTTVVDLRRAGVSANQQVRFRFDLGTDACVGTDGWYLDDVKVLACVLRPVPPATELTPVIRPSRPTRGEPFRVRSVTSVSGHPRTGTASGRVTVWIDGRRIRSGTISTRRTVGEVTLKVTGKQSRRLKPGRHTLRVRYSGNAWAPARTVTKRFRVRPA